MKFILYLLALYAAFRFQRCNSDVTQPQLRPASKSPSSAGPSTVRPSSSIVLQVTGNVYPMGYYYATVNIGNPPKPYFLDIDTGSDLTWVQCDAPCIKCLPAPHPLYKPTKDIVPCSDPLCADLYSQTHQGPLPPCESSSNAQCDYEVQYADDGSSLGILVRDLFSLQYINGTVSKPRIVFGCGYDQEGPTHGTPPHVDGVLGLGLSKVGILSQLQELGVTKNVLGHCLSSQADGYLFFGDQLVPSSGITWTPMSTTEISKHYSLGSAEIYLGGKTSEIKGVSIVFDSGSTYTYFIPRAYDAVVNMLMNDIKQQGKQLNKANFEDDTLPICWKGSKPFKSVQDVKNMFKPITLSFANSKNVWLQMEPEAYLIISNNGNACIGILNGADVGLENFNLIGDISFHDKLVIYDNEKKQIGWAPANCNNLPKS